jgi:amino acid adenylation domain-containing protein
MTLSIKTNRATVMSTPVFNAVHQQLSTRWQGREHEAVLLHSTGSLSWGELDHAANRLAHRLLSQGITAESRVGVSLNRSPAMIVALLAVLRAGGAFVPLDPGYPASRLAHMCSDAGVVCIITHSTLQATLPALPCLCIDDDMRDFSDVDPAVPIHPGQLAYLIYTSGSTGTPKGVAVEHGPLAMHCAAIGARYRMTEHDRVLHFASINFDLAHEYWLMPLLHGASLLITDQELWSPDIACARVRQHNVTVAAFPPGYLNQLAQWLETAQQTLPLRVCAFGGEAMARDSFARICRTIPAEQWINGYGPTETVISPMLWQVSPEHDPVSWQDSAYLPIGTAVGQRAVHILDDHLNPVPPGVGGELYLSGYELARGYHNRPGLSAERFLPHSNGSRLYRTGDLGRWRSDGSVAYLGRQDHQIKLRGLRIEPGEIETVLLSHPDVREAVVLPWRSGTETRLIGYIGTALDTDTGIASLKAHLAARLPDYMAPAQLVLLPQLPRTANGKVAQQALPEPVWESAGYRAPRSALECTLAAIWQSVLEVPQVGLDDNFFALGGHSLLATQMQTLVKTRLLIDLSLRDIFDTSSLSDLADKLAREQDHARDREAAALSEMDAFLNELEH